MTTLRIAALAGVLSGPVSASAVDGNIFAFFDQTPSRCVSGHVPCLQGTTIYVFGILAGASASGITGAEYAVEIGVDASADGWLFGESFDASATTLGTGVFSPVDPSPRGINVSWPSCRPGTDGVVLIETVAAFNLECSPFALRLRVVKHSTSSNQFFQCPLFTLCDAPVYTKVCLGSNLTTCRNPEPPFPNNATCSTGGTTYLYTGPTHPDPCQLAVTAATWSAVKRLYGQ